MAIFSIDYKDDEEAADFADQSGVFEIVQTSSSHGKAMRQVQWASLWRVGQCLVLCVCRWSPLDQSHGAMMPTSQSLY